MTKYLFLISKEQIDLAKTEIETQLEVKLKSLLPELLEAELDVKQTQLQAKQFGYVKQIFELKTVLSQENLFDKNFNELIKNTYKINLLGKTRYKTRELADKIYDQIADPQVDIKNPNHNYFFYFLDKEILLLEEISINDDKTNDRKSHKKKHNHPTSLDPKLAKAMINLVKTKSFHDPFCGVGGLLIEGALMGLEVSGSDIAGGLIEKAKENAEEYNLKLNVYQKNALYIEDSFETIITDLPYGKNSALSEQKEQLYRRFFKKYADLSKQMVVGMDDKVNIQELLKETPWKVEKEFTVYVHKSLSRKIYLLEK